MTRKLLAVGAVALVALLVPAGRAQEKDDLVDNPRYLGWAHAKPGTVVVHRERVKYATGNPEGKVYPGGVEQKDITYRLLQVTKDRAVVRTTVTEYEFLSVVEAAPTRITFPAKVSRSHIEEAKEKLKPKITDEEVTFHGKTLKAKRIELTKVADGTTTTEVILTSDTVPGGVIRKTTVAKKGDDPLYEATIELMDFKLPGAEDGKKAERSE